MTMMQMLHLLAAVILVVGLVPPTSSSSPSDRRHALFISIPLPGHIAPLVSLAHSLQRRNWTTSFASTSQMADVVTSVSSASSSSSSLLSPSSFLSLGGCDAEFSQKESALLASASSDIWMWGSLEILRWVQSLHHCMYQAGVRTVAEMKVKPDIIIADYATWVAIDIAEHHHIPYVLNNCNELNMMPASILRPLPYLPLPGTDAPLLSLLYPSPWLFLQRLFFPLIPPLSGLLIDTLLQPRYNSQRALSLLPPAAIADKLSGHLIIVNTVMGLEYVRPLPPLIAALGPMMDLTMTQDDYRQRLTEQETQWLSERDDVLYVAFGTIAPLTERQLAILSTALSHLALNYSIIWKLSSVDSGRLLASTLSVLPSSLHISSWVSSQLSILSHPHLSLFLSHCGVNSLHESLFFAKPLLCFPVQGDQGDSAQRVQDARVGERIDIKTMTAQLVEDKVRSMLDDSRRAEYKREARRIQSLIRATNGLERATDLIEHVSEWGVDHLRGADERMPMWAKEELDVSIVRLALLWLAWKATKKCWRAMTNKGAHLSRRESSSKSSTDDTVEPHQLSRTSSSHPSNTATDQGLRRRR
jgi:UDP:flavonoid glycosyltransferase YjiC (YdhE family)